MSRRSAQRILFDASDRIAEIVLAERTQGNDDILVVIWFQDRERICVGGKRADLSREALVTEGFPKESVERIQGRRAKSGLWVLLNTPQGDQTFSFECNMELTPVLMAPGGDA